MNKGVEQNELPSGMKIVKTLYGYSLSGIPSKTGVYYPVLRLEMKDKKTGKPSLVYDAKLVILVVYYSEGQKNKALEELASDRRKVRCIKVRVFGEIKYEVRDLLKGQNGKLPVEGSSVYARGERIIVGLLSE